MEEIVSLSYEEEIERNNFLSSEEGAKNDGISTGRRKNSRLGGGSLPKKSQHKTPSKLFTRKNKARARGCVCVCVCVDIERRE